MRRALPCGPNAVPPAPGCALAVAPSDQWWAVFHLSKGREGGEEFVPCIERYRGSEWGISRFLALVSPWTVSTGRDVDPHRHDIEGMYTRPSPEG